MNEINYAELGTRIRSARKLKGITQETLAEHCSLSAAHIGHIERGTRIPSLDTILKIANALGVSVDSLLIDNCNDNNYFVHLSSALKGKNSQKITRFISMVNALADKIDEL